MSMVNQRGFSIAEALVASGILAIVVAGVTTMVGGNSISDVFRGRLQSNNSCLAEANRILNNFKEKGLVRSRYSFPVPESDTAPTAAMTVTTAAAGSVEPGVALADRWRTDMNIYEAPVSSVYPLRPHLQIMGYMNALQAIYNSAKTTYCPASGNGATSYSDGDGNSANDLINGVSSSANLSSAAAYVKIQPYQTADGALVACSSAPALLDIRPAHASGVTLNTSIKEPTSDVSDANSSIAFMKYTGAGKNHPADADASDRSVFMVPTTNAPVDDRGWALTVTVTYKDRNNMDKQCSVQEKFQYSAQPSNIQHFQFEDIDDPLTPGSSATIVDRPTESTDASFLPENINSTIRSRNTASGSTISAPIYPTSDSTASAQNKSYPNTWNPANTLFYGCNNSTNYKPEINLRLKNVRPGSIMMCRNLSYLRTQPTYDSATVQRMNTNSFPQRTTFFSTELLQNAYFSTAATTGDFADGVYGDMVVMGLYYPRSSNNTLDGDYFCRTADGCTDLPRFANGYTGTTPAGGTDLSSSVASPWDSPSLGSGANRVRHFEPVSDNAYSAASTSPTWVPCETINVCDNTGSLASGAGPHPPTFAGFVAGTRTDGTGNLNNDADAYHLQFQNLPVGCEVHIQMAEVDAGYNVQATDFREYIHEKIPGNKLCRAGASGGNGKIAGHNDYEWFFACSTTDLNPNVTTGVGAGSPAINCSSLAAPLTDFTTPCCVDYPFYPEQKATYDP